MRVAKFTSEDGVRGFHAVAPGHEPAEELHEIFKSAENGDKEVNTLEQVRDAVREAVATYREPEQQPVQKAAPSDEEPAGRVVRNDLVVRRANQRMAAALQKMARQTTQDEELAKAAEDKPPSVWRGAFRSRAR